MFFCVVCPRKTHLPSQWRPYADTEVLISLNTAIVAHFTDTGKTTEVTVAGFGPNKSAQEMKKQSEIG